MKDIEHGVKNKKIGVWSVSNDTSYTKENTESEGKSISQIITDFINDLIDDTKFLDMGIILGIPGISGWSLRGKKGYILFE